MRFIPCCISLPRAMDQPRLRQTGKSWQVLQSAHHGEIDHHHITGYLIKRPSPDHDCNVFPKHHPEGRYEDANCLFEL